jgi:putative phage-type endonuclease
MLTPAELTERRNYIGGSDVAAILGLNPYRNITDVYLEKTNQLQARAATSRPADLGNRLEPVLVQLVADTTGEPVELNRRFANDWRSAQVDGWLPDSNRVIEAKAIGLFNPRFDRTEWGPEGTDEIPMMYLVQVLWQMHVSGGESGYLSALLGGGLGHRVYDIPRNNDLITAIDQRISDFWHNHVQTRTEPTQPANLDVYRDRIREPNTYAQINPDHCIQYETLTHQINTSTTARDNLKALILQEMGTADIGTSPYGEFHYKANAKGVRTFRYKGPANE